MVFPSTFLSFGNTIKGCRTCSHVSYFLSPPWDSLSIILSLPPLSSATSHLPPTNNLVDTMVLLPHCPWATTQSCPSPNTDTCIDSKYAPRCCRDRKSV